MIYGTTDFYAATAQLSPLIIVTYLVSSRLNVARTKPASIVKAEWKERQKRARILRDTYDKIIIFGGIGSTGASLLTLYQGKPSLQSAFWTIVPLCIITMVTIGSLLARSDIDEEE
jgi:hypothetical protein